MWFGNIRTKDSINVNKDVRIVTKYEPTPRRHYLLQKVPPSCGKPDPTLHREFKLLPSCCKYRTARVRCIRTKKSFVHVAKMIQIKTEMQM